MRPYLHQFWVETDQGPQQLNCKTLEEAQNLVRQQLPPGQKITIEQRTFEWVGVKTHEVVH
jgi:hypothetical protein